MNVHQTVAHEPSVEEYTDDTEWLSISDLMSGLLLIFALLVVVTLFQLKTLQEETQNKRILVIQALQQQFNSNGINAKVNPETGDITLLESVLFGFNEQELKPEGKVFLNRFLPVYSNVIFSDENISKEITRVVIEGHTSSDGALGYNMQLSLGRANSVFQYINAMENLPVKSEFLKKIQVSGRGPMDAQPIVSLDSDRKVIFRMQFKSEDAFNQVLRINK